MNKHLGAILEYKYLFKLKRQFLFSGKTWPKMMQYNSH